MFGNMGETSATGVAFTRNPVDRRERPLRRVPGQRAGRGRRRRHPHAAEHHRGGAQGRGSDKPSLEALMPEVFKQFADTTKLLEKHYRTCRTWSSPSSAASSGCCRRETASAPRARRFKVAVDMANEGPDQPRGRDHPRRAERARSAPASDARSQGEAHAARDRPAGFARRRERRDRVLGRRRRGGAARRDARRSSCASRPRPRTFTACTPPRAS